MIDRFARLHAEPRRLTDSERLTATVVLVLVVIAAGLWARDPIGFLVGLGTGWILHEASTWLGRRGG